MLVDARDATKCLDAYDAALGQHMKWGMADPESDDWAPLPETIYAAGPGLALVPVVPTAPGAFFRPAPVGGAE